MEPPLSYAYWIKLAPKMKKDHALLTQSIFRFLVRPLNTDHNIK